MKKKLFLTATVVLGVILMAGMAVAMTVSSSQNLTFDERLVDHDNPAVYGNYAVWDRYYDDGSDFMDSDIYLQDLTNLGAGFTMITDDGDCYDPNIDNGRVVYTRLNDGLSSYEIWMYDIAADQYTLIIDELTGWQAFPDISGDKVVFRAWDGDQSCDVIKCIDLADATPSPVQISPDSMPCGLVAISGDYVVFEGSGQIYLKDLAQLATPAVKISQNDVDGYDWPNIDGNKVVYENSSDDGVYLYDILAETTTMISVAGEESEEPDIQGNNVVYTTNIDTGDPDEWVTFYNIAMGTRIIISDPVNYCCPDTPAVWGNNLLYLDHWDGYDEDADWYNDSVYFAKLAPTFDPIPGGTVPINIIEGQVITTNPFIIKVFPTGGTEIVRVEFYVGGVLIGSDYSPNAEGVWEYPWDTSLYQGRVTVVAYDAAGESVTIERNTTVALELPYTGI